MRRAKESFVDTLAMLVPLENARILEIGCGTGNYTKSLAEKCAHLTAVDPDPASIAFARTNVRSPNVTFGQASAEDLSAISGPFDLAIFTLSLHHVPLPLMGRAIDEAIRVTDPDGFIVFLEPAQDGSFFDAELRFHACDGDEREAKRRAYEAMTHHPGLVRVAELDDQTEFHWDSIEDFHVTMRPRNNLADLAPFLAEHRFTLRANRRVNLFKIKPS